MGQGTHQFASVQLARYVTALANRGTVYDLSLIDKETDSQGNLVKDYSPAVASTLDFQDKHLGCSPTRYAPGSYQQFDQACVWMVWTYTCR